MMVLPNDLRKKACLVTGASRGIGAAVARALGRCGSHVAVHYRASRDEAAPSYRILSKRAVVPSSFSETSPSVGLSSN